MPTTDAPNGSNFQRILVAVGATKTSGRAIRDAVRICLDHQSQLKIVHVAVLPVNGAEGAYFGGMYRATLWSGRTALARALAEARSAGVDANDVFVEQAGGSAAQAILAEGRNCGAQLIVIGAPPRRAFCGIFGGSVAETVLRTATVPVLAVPKQLAQQTQQSTRE